MQNSSNDSTKEETSLLNSQEKLQSLDPNTDVLEKYQKLEKLYHKSEKLRIAMKKRHNKIYKALKTKIKNLENQVGILQKTPSVATNIFNDDQIKILTGKYRKIPKWCDNTLVKAYQLKFACGISGYKELLHQRHPLPSLTTLRNKLEENWKFLCGSPDEIFLFLKIKISKFSNLMNRDCIIIMDEISITPRLCYDISTGTYVGNVTLPEHDTTEVATHVLVFMLAGISQRWKQVIEFILANIQMVVNSNHLY